METNSSKDSSRASSSTHSTTPEVSTIEISQDQANALMGVDIQERKHMTVKTSDLVPQRSGILQTVRTATGDPVIGDLGPDHIVKVGGVPMKLSAAERLGYVKRDANGQYVDSTVEQEVEAKKAETEKAKTDAELNQFPVPMSEDGKEFLGDLQNALNAIQVSPRAFVLDVIKDEDQAYNRYVPLMAQLTGSTPEAIAADIAATGAEVINQIAALAQQEGIEDLEALGDWMEQGNASRVNAAVLEQLDGNALPMRRLLQDYRANHQRADNRVPEGMTAHKTNDGTAWIQVKLPSGKVMGVSVATARKMGLVK